MLGWAQETQTTPRNSTPKRKNDVLRFVQKKATHHVFLGLQKKTAFSKHEVYLLKKSSPPKMPLDPKKSSPVVLLPCKTFPNRPYPLTNFPQPKQSSNEGTWKFPFSRPYLQRRTLQKARPSPTQILQLQKVSLKKKNRLGEVVSEFDEKQKCIICSIINCVVKAFLFFVSVVSFITYKNVLDGVQVVLES